jgi:hypothetical protein
MAENAIEKTRTRATRFLDAWFIVAPLLIIAFYIHCAFLLISRGQWYLSPCLPKGHAAYVTPTVFAVLFIEILIVAILWFASAVLIRTMVRKQPSIRLKALWYIAAFVFSPIVCHLLLLHQTATA